MKRNVFNGHYQETERERTKGDLIVAAISLAIGVPAVILVIAVIFKLAE